MSTLASTVAAASHPPSTPVATARLIANNIAINGCTGLCGSGSEGRELFSTVDGGSTLIPWTSVHIDMDIGLFRASSATCPREEAHPFGGEFI